MTTYVDDAKNPYGPLILSHCTSDSKEELFEMMKNIGISLKHFQNENDYKWHFDISQSKKDIAIRHYGAIEVTQRKMVKFINERRDKNDNNI